MKSALGVLPLLGCLRPLIAQAGSGAEHALLPLLSLLAATVCAELAVFPIAAAAFSRVTIAGLALNFVAVPLMTVTQLGGMCAIGAGLLEGALAAPFGYAAHLAAAGIVESARFVDVVPWLAYRVPAPAPPSRSDAITVAWRSVYSAAASASCGLVELGLPLGPAPRPRWVLSM